jgi:transposase
MRTPVIVLSRPRRRRLLRVARRATDAALRVRYMIVLHTAAGKSQRQAAAALGCSVSTVKRTRARWRACGEAGLTDRRADGRGGPPPKAGERYASFLRWALRFSPRFHGRRRPTWTQELMIAVMCDYGHARVSRTTVGRLLRRLRVRRGAPKPAPRGCPWGRRAKAARLRLIRSLVGSLAPGEAAVWEDECDVHLNPRIGPDWMLPGTQRRVATPGTDVRRYVAGALDAATGRLVWARSERKDSGLFIDLLKKLLDEYEGKGVVHVILDNYAVHASRRTKRWLAEHGHKFRLHFLPPYCPDDNRIERKVWREMHANVTRNHECRSIDELMNEVTLYLMRHNRAAKLRWLRSA